MSRRTTAAPHFLLFLAIVAAVVFLYFHTAPRPYRRRPESARSRGFPEADRQERPRAEGERGTRRGRETPESCDAAGTTCQSRYFGLWTRPEKGGCRTRTKQGFPVPDPRCTPGGINPSVSVEVLRNPAWRTRCIRNCETSEAEKHVAYGWYGVRKPRHNSDENQVCELDHLVPLELGGADGLGNIWPQCGPDGVTLRNRFFKMKDRVENYLEDQVKTGRMPLGEAQRGIATDWVTYLPEANRWCAAGGRC